MLLYYMFSEFTFTLKNIFTNSRPCLENYDISKSTCDCDFGNPSGHSSGSFVLYFWLFYEFLYKNNNILL